ncbi:hypothetical protein GWI33_011606, partial [Rhynchophorus ferrugineus]
PSQQDGGKNKETVNRVERPGEYLTSGGRTGTSFCIGIPSLSRGDAVSQWGRSGFLLGLVKK